MFLHPGKNSCKTLNGKYTLLANWNFSKENTWKMLFFVCLKVYGWRFWLALKISISFEQMYSILHIHTCETKALLFSCVLSQLNVKTVYIYCIKQILKHVLKTERAEPWSDESLVYVRKKGAEKRVTVAKALFTIFIMHISVYEFLVFMRFFFLLLFVSFLCFSSHALNAWVFIEVDIFFYSLLSAACRKCSHLNGVWAI